MSVNITYVGFARMKSFDERKTIVGNAPTFMMTIAELNGSRSMMERKIGMDTSETCCAGWIVYWQT